MCPWLPFPPLIPQQNGSSGTAIRLLLSLKYLRHIEDALCFLLRYSVYFLVLYSQVCVANGWKTWTWSSVVTDTCQSKAEMQSMCVHLVAGVQLCWPLAGLVRLVCSDGSSQGGKRKEESLSSQLETGRRQGESLCVLISTTGFAS